MHIGIFSDSINIPPKEGINVHTYELLCYLSAVKDVTVTLFVCNRGWLDTQRLKQEPFDTVLIPEDQFYDIDHITDIISANKLDIAQSYMTYFGAVILGPACKSAMIPMVAEFHDLEEDVVPLYFSAKEMAAATADHVYFQELEADYASLVRVMSFYDFKTLNTRWESTDRHAKLSWLPVSMMLPEPLQTGRRDRVIYIGNMSYAPNAEGAAIVRELIAPSDRAINYDLIGRGSEAYEEENIRTFGMVDSLDPYLTTAAVGISPIVRGSGMKIKNMTYLKYGIPLLTTEVGSRGYPATKAIIIENDFRKWPSILGSLLKNSDRLEYLSKTALKYFSAHFQADIVNSKLIECYKHTIKTYDPSRVTAHSKNDRNINMKHVYWLREVRENQSKPASTIQYVKGIS